MMGDLKVKKNITTVLKINSDIRLENSKNEG